MMGNDVSGVSVDDRQRTTKQEVWIWKGVVVIAREFAVACGKEIYDALQIRVVDRPKNQIETSLVLAAAVRNV